MSRPAHIPSYCLHKQSGQAIVTLTDNLGGRRDVLLGKYNTAESRSEYVRVIGEWEARGRRLTADADPSGISVNEVLLAFLEHAERHYRRDDGTQTSEVREYKAAIRPARDPEEAVSFMLKLVGMLPPDVQRQVFERMEAQGMFAKRGYRLLRVLQSEDITPGSGSFFPIVSQVKGAAGAHADEPFDESSGFYIRGVTDSRRGEVVGVAAATPEELEAITAGVRAGRKLGRRTPSHDIRQRNLEIVRLRDEEGLDFAAIGRRLKRANSAWTTKDGNPLKASAVRKAYHETKLLIATGTISTERTD